MRRTWDALAAGETAVYVGDPATRGGRSSPGSSGGSAPTRAAGRCVEVGCGPGRMTGALAERFDRVVALDVSPAMLEQARANVTAPNVEFVAVSGRAARGRRGRESQTRSSATSSSSTCPRRGSSARTCSSSRRVLAPARRGVRPGARARRRARPRVARRPRAPLVRLARRPDQGAAFRGYRLTRARARRRARRRRSPRASPRTKGPPPTASAATASCGSPADDRRRTRRLRRPARRDASWSSSAGRRSRSSSSSSACRCTTSSCRSSTGAASAAARSTRSRPGRRSCSRPRSPRSRSRAIRARAAARSARTSSTGSRSPTRRSSLLYAVIPQSALGGHAGAKAIAYGLRHDLVLRRRVLPRPLAAARRPPHALGDRRRRGRGRRLGPDRGLRRPDRVVAALGRGRLLPPRARLRLPRAGRPAGELRLQHERRALPPARLDLRLAARDRVHARRRVAPAGNGPPAAADRDRARGRLRAPACSGRSRARRSSRSRSACSSLAVARRRWWPAAAAVGAVAVGFAFAAVFHDIAPRTHWFKSDLPYQEAQAQAKGPLPTGSGLLGHGQSSASRRSRATGRACGTGSARSSTTRRATGSGTPARPRSASA